MPLLAVTDSELAQLRNDLRRARHSVPQRPMRGRGSQAQMIGQSVVISFPWQVYVAGGTGDSAWRTFRVKRGEIMKPLDSTILTANNDDESGSPLTAVVPASETKHLFYLSISITCNTSAGTCTLGTPTILHDSAIGLFNRMGITEWFFILAEVTTGADPGPTPIIYQHYSAQIELPQLVLDPATSPNPDSNGCFAVLKVV
jgi:hypothetical protein